MKVVLILVDGLRPEALENIPFAQILKENGTYTMQGSAVMPSVTLPCHMSLFHSVDPQRHGTTTNTYAPQVRPIRGLCEVLSAHKKRSAFFYSWAPLRDLVRPGSVTYSGFYKGGDIGYDKANKQLTDNAIDCIKHGEPDFIFLYLGDTDAVGHKYGWMSEEYMASVKRSFDDIERVMQTLDDSWSVIITADHGGHGRHHGTDMPEDMTIPILFVGKDFAKGKELDSVSIMDIAPTITALFGVEADEDWEGKSLI